VGGMVGLSFEVVSVVVEVGFLVRSMVSAVFGLC